MNNNIKIRKMSKKTILIMVLLIIFGIMSIFLVQNGHSSKATKILNKLGYLNIKNVKVFAKKQFLAQDTNIKGYQYSLKFVNIDTNKRCKGFIFRDFKGNINKDLQCEKIKKGAI